MTAEVQVASPESMAQAVPLLAPETSTPPSTSNSDYDEYVDEADSSPYFDSVCALENEGGWNIQSYPDEITYNLVGAICAELNAPPEPVLELFGDSWVGYASSQGYGPMLDFFGKDMRSLLRNLDALHTRLKTVFPHLRPPALGCEELAPDRYRLHYVSHRPGLTHFVVGLIRGMGKRFGEQVTVAIEQTRAGGADHDTFLITIGPDQAANHVG